MEFGLGEDQRQFDAALRGFLGDRVSMATRHAAAETGFDAALWAGLTELGVPGLLVPEEHGGSGLGLMDAALVAKALGHAAAPAPFLGSAVLAPLALRWLGDAAQQARFLPEIAAGRMRIAVGFGALAGTTGAGTLRREGGRLSGSVTGAFDAGGATHLLLALPPGGTLPRPEAGLEAHPQGGLTAHPQASLEADPRADLEIQPQGGSGGHPQSGLATHPQAGLATHPQGGLVPGPQAGLALVAVDAPGVTLRPRPSLDRLRPLVDADFAAAAVEWLDAGDARRVLEAGRVMLAAETLGASQAMLDQAVAYALQRRQFGRVIASFQGVKHACAEMAAQLQPCQAFVWYAAQAQDAPDADARMLACQVKAHLDEVGREVARHATEVHGGMGFTELLGLPFWFKRIAANRQLLGGPERCREEAALAQGFAAA